MLKRGSRKVKFLAILMCVMLLIVSMPDVSFATVEVENLQVVHDDRIVVEVSSDGNNDNPIEDVPNEPVLDETKAPEVEESNEPALDETKPPELETEQPTEAPDEPTASPTEAPDEPTVSPTEAPDEPTVSPTEAPDEPTVAPTEASKEPTVAPTDAVPTANPTEEPKVEESEEPVYGIMPLIGDEEYAVVVTIESGNQYIEYYSPGELVTLEVPTKEHYIFTGWEVVCDFSVTIGNNKFVMPAARVDIAAQWEPEVYSIAIYYLSSTGENLRAAKFADVMYGYEFTLDSDYSIPTIDGYTATKITRDGDANQWTDLDNFRDFMNISAVEKNEVFYVWYEPSDVTYSVYHYKQNLDGTYPESATESEEFSGKYGDKIRLSSYVKSYTGFTWDGNSGEITLATSGNVIRIYYERNSYKLFYEKADDNTDSITYLFEAEVKLSTLGTPTRVGYTFSNWQTSAGEDVTGDAFSMPAHDVTLVAKWNPNEVTYTVYYWGETDASAQAWTDSYHSSNSANLTPTAYSYICKETTTGVTGTTIKREDIPTPDGGLIPPSVYSYETMQEDVVIDADGTTIINVYYRKNAFFYRFIRNGDLYEWEGHTGYIYHKYGANLIAYWPTLTSGKAIVWKRTDGSNLIVTAPSAAKEAANVELRYDTTSSSTFTLWAYKENVEGGYEGSVKYEYVTFSGFTALSITMRANRLPEGFDYDSYYSNTKGAWVSFKVDDTISDSQNIGSTDIRLKRKFYTITFNDGNVDVSTSNEIRFEASISNVVVPEIRTPEAFSGYQFVGFRAAHNGILYEGATPEEAYETFKNAIGDKMPATNVTLTATWQAPIYRVNFYKDSTLTEYLGGEDVNRGKTVVNMPEIPAYENHTFNGWFYMDGEVEKLYWDGKTILSDMDVYAKWIVDEVIYADVLVKHNYLLEDGTIDYTDEEVVEAIVGNVTTLNSRETQGYFPDFTSQNIEVKESGNEVIFNYTPLGEVEYTVRYVDADGNELISDVKKTSDKLLVTETYKYIPKCTPRTISQTLKLSSNPENNVIVFVYDVEGTNTYTIKHYLQELDGTYTLYETEENLEARNYTKVYATEKTYDGFAFYPDISTTYGWVVPNSKLVLALYYNRMEYTVEYRYADGYAIPDGAPILPETKTYMFGESVTVEDTLSLPNGYKFVGWTYAEDGSSASGTFEMPKKNVVIEGHFEQLDYYIVVYWEHEDGVYEGGTYTWDCDNLEYLYNSDDAGWSKVPYVKCTVKNYGSKAVNLELTAEVDLWSQFFSDGGNPFDNLGKVTLAGNGAEHVFEFRNDIELVWDYDKLDDKAYDIAVYGEGTEDYTNNFKLNVTVAE